MKKPHMICSWCRKIYKGDPDGELQGHGICEPCKDRILAKDEAEDNDNGETSDAGKGSEI